MHNGGSLSRRWLATERSKVVIWCNSYLMLFGVLGVSCRILFSIVIYSYVSCSGS